MLWGIGIASFSLAGWQASRMQRWLSVLGWLVGALGVGSGIGATFLVSRDLLAGAALSGFGLLAPIWILTVSLSLLRAAKSERVAAGGGEVVVSM